MLSLKEIVEYFNINGANRVFYKNLAVNDNSKNQPYLGSGWDIVNILPLGEISENPGDKRPNFKCNLNLYWLNNNGELNNAPHAKLILYEKYPEIRLSGFIMGCLDKNRLGRLMNPERDKTPERTLFLAVTTDKRVLAYVRHSDQKFQNELKHISIKDFGKLTEIKINNGVASVDELKFKLKSLMDKGWIRARYLKKIDGSVEEVFIGKHNNSHGLTLEAEFGLLKDDKNKPDWRGWELKGKLIKTESQYSNSLAVTLFTPAPDGGFINENYKEFMEKYGVKKINGRIDFAKIHFCDEEHKETKLKLKLDGYQNNKIEPGGALKLIDPKDKIVMSWSFAKLMEMWNRKHGRIVYVPSMRKNEGDNTFCKYFGPISYGIGSDFNKFLASLKSKFIKYDPGCKIDKKDNRRHQFRISSKNSFNLYHDWYDDIEL